MDRERRGNPKHDAVTVDTSPAPAATVTYPFTATRLAALMGRFDQRDRECSTERVASVEVGDQEHDEWSRWGATRSTQGTADFRTRHSGAPRVWVAHVLDPT